MKKINIKELLKKVGLSILVAYGVFLSVHIVKEVSFMWIQVVSEGLQKISLTGLLGEGVVSKMLSYLTIPFDTLVLFAVFLLPAAILSKLLDKFAKRVLKNSYKYARLGYLVLLLLSLYVI